MNSSSWPPAEVDLVPGLHHLVLEHLVEARVHPCADRLSSGDVVAHAASEVRVRYRLADQLLRLLRLQSMECQQVFAQPTQVIWHCSLYLLRFQRRDDERLHLAATIS